MKRLLTISTSVFVSLLTSNALAVDLFTYDAPQASHSAKKSSSDNKAPSAFSAKFNSIAMEQESIDINLPHKIISAKRMSVVGKPSERITPYTLEGQNGFVAINSNNNSIESLTIFDDETSDVFKGVMQADGSMAFSKVDIDAFICINYEDASENAPIAAAADISYYQSLTELTLPQVTSLQSRPDASKVLYLDYFAGNVTDTAWNTGDYAGGIAYANYSYDSDASTFSLIDRQSMYAGWAETAEDYAPFDVNVTTDLGVYEAASHRNKSKIIATSTNWRNSGGVAYVGVFGERNDDFYTIGWTFNKGFGTLGMTNSHESGHQMGLGHDGTSNREYYGGSGNAGPIMGGPFGKDFVHWNKGDYPDANQQQDDIAIIEARLGALADDFGNDNASATPINGQEIVGFISPAGLAADTDVFSFVLDSSRTVSLTVRSLFDQPLGGRGDNTAGGVNLSAKIELRDASNALIKQTVPTNAAINNTFRFDQILAAGTYFLKIEPQAYEPNEFNSYGNGGYYQILNDLGSSTPAPDLVVESASVNDNSLNADDRFTLSVSAKNRGNRNSTATTLTYFRSNDSTISSSDVSVGTDAVASLTPGASGSETIELVAPASPGNYYFGACIATVNGELNTANNCSAGVLMTIASTVDLVVEAPTVSNATLASNQRFQLSANVKNLGNSNSTATTLTYYQSTNQTISTFDTRVGTDSVSVLAANASGAQSINLDAPTAAGRYYYGACVTTFNGENNNNNCSSSVLITVTETEVVDLIIESATVNNADLAPSQTFQLLASVKNQGNTSSSDTNLTYYRSTDSTISTQDVNVGGDSIGRLVANESRQESIDLVAPLTPGNYYYGACVATFSGETANNNCSISIRVTVVGQNPIKPDRYEPNNDRLSAKSIVKDTAQVHSIHELGDEDWLKFTLSSPAERLVIETSGSHVSDTRLWLYDSNANELAFDDDGGKGTYSKISVNTTLAAGTYYIQVDELNNDNLIADYTVKLSFDSTQTEEQFCLPVKASNGNLVVICL